MMIYQKQAKSGFFNHHLHYKEKPGMTEFAYKPFLFQPSSQLLPPAVSSNYIVKVIKSLYNVPETSTKCFAIYYPHYKGEL